MGIRINQNIAAMNAYRNLSVTEGQMSKSLERLSSGFRINRAADDAAGLAISEKLRGQVGGLKQAVNNAQNGISLIQTAEGALNESHSILQRMRELAVQAANDTNTSTDRSQIQKEVTALTEELDRIAGATEFNTQKLLDGSFTARKLQIGANTGQTIDVTITAMDTATLGVTGAVAKGYAGTGAESASITGTPPSGAFTLDGTDVLDSSGSKVGAYNNTTFEVTFNADNGAGTVVFNKSAWSDVTPGSEKGTFTVSNAVDLTSQANASTAISTIDAAIEQVSGQRSTLGAVQNRLDHTINNLSVAAENLAASESRIRDTDMAAEMMSFTRAQILSQAGTAMLAQANQIPQSVLQLLR